MLITCFFSENEWSKTPFVFIALVTREKITVIKKARTRDTSVLRRVYCINVFLLSIKKKK